MKLVSYLKDGQDQLALLQDGYLYDMEALHPELPGSIELFLQVWEEALPFVQHAEEVIREAKLGVPKGFPFEEAALMAPVPFPASCRDGYAFRQHVETARLNRGAAMIPEFDQFPVFYFTNHHAVTGPGKVAFMPDHFQQLDFELEVAVVICRHGRNIRAADAENYIGGFMIMNDWSARTLQREEMKLNLGPAKGKDFCTSFGPMLVTPDELEPFKTAARPGHTGHTYNLKMQCRVNGKQVSQGNLGDMNWTFAEIIERCSYGIDLYPGDIIGSGTVGTGCFLELNGTGKRTDPAYQEQWLQPGDVVEMEVEGLGILSNTIIAEETDYSILALKHN